MKITELSDKEYAITDLVLDDIYNKRYCVFDFEATGPDQLNDYITQIGAVIINDAGSITAQYKTLVRPAKPIPEAIERLTGIYNKDVEEARTFSEVFGEFMAFIEGCVLITQAGYEFDYPLLVEECRRNQLFIHDQITIDTKALFTFLHPEVSDIVSTNFLIHYYNINDSDIQRHDALGDSILISRFFYKMIEECLHREIRTIRIEHLIVKRMKLTPLM